MGELAERSGVSRSTLSRAERAETSPTAALLNRLCHVYGRTMSQLLSEVEAEPVTVVRAADQAVWEDRSSGFVRRSVSPPAAGLRGELVEGRLTAGADIAYDGPSVPGLEQHIWVLAGALSVTDRGMEHELAAGDGQATHVDVKVRIRRRHFVQALGEGVLEKDVLLAHDAHGLFGDGGGREEAGAPGVHDIAAVSAGEALGHLAAASVADADEDDAAHRCGYSLWRKSSCTRRSLLSSGWNVATR